MTKPKRKPRRRKPVVVDKEMYVVWLPNEIRLFPFQQDAAKVGQYEIANVRIEVIEGQT